MTDQPLLSIRELEVSFVSTDGAVPAVRGVSLDIAPNEIVGLVGESGSGKSTIAQCILRVLGPPGFIHGGAIELEGADLLKASEAELEAIRWRRIGMVFQSSMNALNPVMKVEAQLRDAIEAHEQRMPDDELRSRTQSLLELVELGAEHGGLYPHMLSGGMRQRVVIAMALALNPDLLIMDEPTTALDVIVQRDILQRILDLRAEQGFSVLFITHDLPLMLDFADWVAVMREGVLVEKAEVEALRSAPQHAYTQELMRAQSLVR